MRVRSAVFVLTVASLASALPPKGGGIDKPIVKQPPAVLADEGCVPKTDSSPLKISLPFNGNTTDVTGHCNDGYRTDAKLVAGVRAAASDQAYEFDGVDDYLSVREGQKYDLTKFTIGMHIMPLSLPIGPVAQTAPQNCAHSILAGKGSGVAPETDGNFRLELYRCGGSSTFLFSYSHRFYTAGNPQGQATGLTDWQTPIEWKRWTHLGVTYENGTLALWINGARTKLATNIPAPMQVKSLIRLGAKENPKPNDPQDKAFHGAIDNFRVYDRALTDAEMKDLPRKSAAGEL